MASFGRYQLVRRIAVGGMAEVFLATAAGAGEPLVVKRLLPHLGDRPQFVRMFLDEARLTARLEHDNVVRIDDFGEADGLHYIAMEYVDGLSLADLLFQLERRAEPRLERSLACLIVAEACAGLAYAHEQSDDQGRPLGVVHRDVSPDNILLSRAGEVKLADFGIAKARSQISRTLPGQVKGKLRYMSPEQVRRDPEIDHRSDIFSTGVVLYELLVGEQLFPQVNDAAVLSEIISGEYPPALPPALPEPLARILGCALQKAPAARYGHASEMRRELIACLDGDRDALLATLGSLVRGVLPEPRAPSTVRDQRSTEVGTEPGAGSAKETIQGMPMLVVPDTDVDEELLFGEDAADTIRDLPAFDEDDLVQTDRDLEVADTIRQVEAIGSEVTGSDQKTPTPVQSPPDHAAPAFTGRPPLGGTANTDSELIALPDDDGPPPIALFEEHSPTRRILRWTERITHGAVSKWTKLALAGVGFALSFVVVLALLRC